MYNVSNDFLNAISQPTRRMDCYFEYNGNRYNPVSLNIEDNIYSTGTSSFVGTFIAKNGTIKVNFKDELNLENEYIDIFMGVYINDTNVEYVPFGRFFIYGVKSSTEYQIMDSKMLFNTLFDGSTISYPTTMMSLLEEVCNQAGVVLATTDYPNKNLAIPYQLFFGNNALCSDVIEAIAIAAGAVAHINRENELELKWFSIVDNYQIGIDAQSKQIETTDTYGPINSLVLSREPQNDNVYIRDDESIAINGLSELKIVNNPILDLDRYTSRLELFDRISGFEYIPFKCDLQGQIHLDSCDVVQIEDRQGNLVCSHIFNHSLNYKGGISSAFETTAQTKNQIEYSVASDEKRLLNVELIVNKQDGEIKAIVEEQQDHEDKISQLTIGVDSIKAEVEKVSGFSVILNMNGNAGYDSWQFQSKGLLPSPSLLPSKTLLPWRRNMPTFVVEDYGSLSDTGLYFIVPGSAITQRAAFIMGGENYSFQCKRSEGSGRFAVYIQEWSDPVEDMDSETLILDTQNNPLQYESASIVLGASTTFVKLRIQSFDEKFGITELMFNQGAPRGFVNGPDDIYYYAKSEITQLANQINLRVTKDEFGSEIDILSDEINLKVGTDEIVSAINLSPEQVTINSSKISLEGLTTINGSVVIDTDGKLHAVDAEFKGTISSSDIKGSTITGSTINVTTDLRVGNNIYLGDYTDEDTAKTISLNDAFSIYARNSVMNIGNYNSTSGAGVVDGTIQFRKTGAIYVKAVSFLRLAMSDEFIYMIDGSITSSRAIVASSDERLKKDIKQVDLTELFDAIDVKSFSYLNDDKKTIGVIAQDFIGNEFEKSVLSKGEDGYYAVDYNALNMATAHTLKKLIKRVEELERKLQ